LLRKPEADASEGSMGLGSRLTHPHFSYSDRGPDVPAGSRQSDGRHRGRASNRQGFHAECASRLRPNHARDGRVSSHRVM